MISRVRSGNGGQSEYDLLIIGSGGAGMAAALRASELGASAAIVESSVLGGTCVNVGCIPSKYLIEVARHFHTARTAVPGMTACEPQLAWRAVLERKSEIVEALRRERYQDVIDAHDRITLLRGRAELTETGGVRVGDQQVAAAKLIIATGTRADLPSVPGLAQAGALDSTSVMELDTLPASMIVIGGGAVGLELGQAFSRFGVAVTIIEAMDDILPTEDPQLAQLLAEALRTEGIDIHTSTKVSRVTRQTGGIKVEFEQRGVRRTLNAACLLVATGRRAHTDGLGLATAGVAVNERGFIQVDEFMRTSNPDIYAAGDVTGLPGFVYVAALAGGIAAQTALADHRGDQPIPIDLSATPRVVFTQPQLAAVGLTETEASAAGRSVKTTTMPVSYLPRAIVSGRTEGVIKLIADADNDQLLGAHMLAENAGDVIGEAVLAIRYGLTVQQLVAALHPYLTWAEGLKLAGQTFTKDVAKLSCCA